MKILGASVSYAEISKTSHKAEMTLYRTLNGTSLTFIKSDQVYSMAQESVYELKEMSVEIVLSESHGAKSTVREERMYMNAEIKRENIQWRKFLRYLKPVPLKT